MEMRSLRRRPSEFEVQLSAARPRPSDAFRAALTEEIQTVKDLATTSEPQQVSNSPADDQYRPGKGCGDKNHPHTREQECKMSIKDVSAKEGNSGTKTFTFVVSLNGPPIDPVSASYATGLTAGTATPGVDYMPVSGSVIFAPGETSKTIDVPVIGDNVREPNETFFVTLSNPSANVIIVDNLGQGTILNDDR
jgi:hypothetical protein